MKSLTVHNDNDLNMMIQSYVAQGFVVAHKTATSATLSKKKTFNWLIAGLGFCFLFLGFFAYLGYYMMKKDEFITINLISERQAA